MAKKRLRLDKIKPITSFQSKSKSVSNAKVSLNVSGSNFQREMFRGENSGQIDVLNFVEENADPLQVNLDQDRKSMADTQTTFNAQPGTIQMMNRNSTQKLELIFGTENG